MYCKECGQEIQDKSKFCSHCGSVQIEEEIIANKESINKENLEISSTSKFDELKQNNNVNKVIGWYLAWVILHLGIMLICSDGIFDGGNMESMRFWPFGRYAYFDEPDYYDITEFLVYTIFPIAIFFVWSLLKPNKNE